MSDSIRLPRGRRDDHIIMPSKYDSLEFKAINSFVSSQTFNLVPHFGSMNKMFSKRQLCNDWRRRENRSRQIIFTQPFLAINNLNKLYNQIIKGLRRGPPRQSSGKVLTSSAGGPGSIPSQGPHHTKDVIKMVPVVPLFSTKLSKGKILAFSQDSRQENKCNG